MSLTLLVSVLFLDFHTWYVPPASSPQVAKSHGAKQAAQQVAYLWAKSLGGDSSVKLLTKFGLLESAIDYASENGYDPQPTAPLVLMCALV